MEESDGSSGEKIDLGEFLQNVSRQSTVEKPKINEDDPENQGLLGKLFGKLIV